MFEKIICGKNKQTNKVCKLMVFINLFVVGVKNKFDSMSAKLFKASEGSGLKALEGLLELGR